MCVPNQLRFHSILVPQSISVTNFTSYTVKVTSSYVHIMLLLSRKLNPPLFARTHLPSYPCACPVATIFFYLRFCHFPQFESFLIFTALPPSYFLCLSTWWVAMLASLYFFINHLCTHPHSNLTNNSFYFLNSLAHVHYQLIICNFWLHNFS